MNIEKAGVKVGGQLVSNPPAAGVAADFTPSKNPSPRVFPNIVIMRTGYLQVDQKLRTLSNFCWNALKTTIQTDMI